MERYAAAASASAPVVLRTAMVSAQYQLPAAAAGRAEYAVTEDAFVQKAPRNAMIDA